jgi:hypothetical protein
MSRKFCFTRDPFSNNDLARRSCSMVSVNFRCVRAPSHEGIDQGKFECGRAVDCTPVAALSKRKKIATSVAFALPLPKKPEQNSAQYRQSCKEGEIAMVLAASDRYTLIITPHLPVLNGPPDARYHAQRSDNETYQGDTDLTKEFSISDLSWLADSEKCFQDVSNHRQPPPYFCLVRAAPF